MSDLTVGMKLRMVMRFTYGNGVEGYNVFHGNVDDADSSPIFPATLESAAAGFYLHIWSAMSAVLSNHTTLKDITVYSLNTQGTAINGAVFIAPPNTVGGISNEPYLDPLMCLTYRQNRLQVGVRNGYKAIAGIAQGMGNEATATTYPGVNALSAKLVGTFPTASPVLNVLTASPNNAIRIAVQRRVDNGDVLDPVEYWYPTSAQFVKIGTRASRDD